MPVRKLKITLPFSDSQFLNCCWLQVVGIPIGTSFTPLIADLFLFCYERDFVISLSADYYAEIIEAFISKSRYLDDLLNIDNTYFDLMVKQIYPSELQRDDLDLVL